MEARIAQVLGTETTIKLRPVFLEEPSLVIRGLVSPPELQRSGSQMIFAFVNGRPVRDRTLNHSILSAYDSLIPKGKFPTVVLFMDLDPELVDVNVHPTKREVRFRRPGDVLEAIRRAIREGLRRPSAMPFHPPEASRSAPPPQPLSGVRQPTPLWGREDQSGLGPSANLDDPSASTPPPAQAMPVQLSTGSAAPTASQNRLSPPFDFLDQDIPNRSQEPRFSRCRPIGQFMNTYILVEDGDGLILIDQHAAHERILFNQISSRAGREASQRLLQSVVFELMPRQAAVLRRWAPHLGEMGFEIESFGGDSFVVQAVPAALSRMAPDLILRDLVEKLPEEETAPRIDLFTRLAQSAACHDAIKANQKLQPEELRQLLQSLDAACIASTCPHGRPVWVKLGAAEIARMFQRT
jgi:DNA mismatch repair protein MutL